MSALVSDQSFELVAESLRVDEKNRISLTKLMKKFPDLKKGCTYRLYTNQHGQIVLQPMVEIPIQEQWLFKNKMALASVKRGIEQADKGKAKSLGSFAKFTEES